MNQKGFVPPFWFIIGIILIFVGLFVGGIAILIKTGFFYLLGSLAALVLAFIGGQANKLKGVQGLRKKR